MIPLGMSSMNAVAQSEIYRTVDKHGNVVFTDTPPASGVSSETVDMRPVNSAAPPPNIPAREPPKEKEEASSATVSITAPANESTIPMGPGNFEVVAGVAPALGPKQKLQLLMDGEPQGEPQGSRNWALTNVFRGQHDLTVQLLNADGDVVTTSEPVRVYVQRPSVINNPAINPPAINPGAAAAGGQARPLAR
ncbi:MAG: DUF4124 domain-containing protein [Halioglobus sp.]